MRAREIADDYPVLNLDVDVLDAARLLTQDRLPGIVLTDDAGRPHSVLPDSQVLRLLVPPYVQRDPTLAKVYDEAEADRIAARLSGRTVRQLLPAENTVDLPAVGPSATVMEIAAQMARLRSPLTVVVERERMQGVITTTRLLDHILPPP